MVSTCGSTSPSTELADDDPRDQLTQDRRLADSLGQAADDLGGDQHDDQHRKQFRDFKMMQRLLLQIPDPRGQSNTSSGLVDFGRGRIESCTYVFIP